MKLKKSVVLNKNPEKKLFKIRGHHAVKLKDIIQKLSKKISLLLTIFVEFLTKKKLNLNMQAY